MMKYVYLLINLSAVSIPVIFSFHPRLQFFKQWKAFFKANILVAPVFIFFDSLFTRYAVWGFNPDYVSGIHLFYLPFEEILFFICIPFACVFTYHCLGLFYRFEWNKKIENLLVNLLAAALFTIGLFYIDKLYTASTFISLSVLLLLINYFFKVSWMGKFLLVYAVLLIPFLIVNGILTGTGLEQPIVWYNNTENLGIRFLTIPIEDVFYGMELILLHVFFFERFKK
jgi:lycopene cyclase domain-containing protein